MKRRILSIVLTICMVLMLLPITVFAANDDAADLQDLLNVGGTVTLTKDYTIEATLEVKNTVTLDLNGHVIKMTGSGSVIKVESGGNLTMTDSNDTATHTDTSLPAGGVITGGNTSQYAGGVDVNGGSMTMNGGTIANCSAYEGGGVQVAYGSFTMNGGTITNCSAENSGGGVYIYSDSFTMNGGTIANCSAEYGGGVAAADSFTMTGGTITNCNATTSNLALGGGGVYLSKTYTFTMTGGTIENCSAASTFGGGVFSHGDFSMSGNAIIRGCSAKYAGGVNIESGSTLFTMTGGTIEGCIATAYRESDAVKIAIKASLLANGGIVKGAVAFSSLSAINTTSTDSCTKFYNKVTSNGTIGGGVYYGGISGSGTFSGTYHTVTFDTNGGSSVPTQWLVNTDKEPALQPADPTRDGYQAFDGWYKGDARYDFSQPVTQDIILTAKFSNPKTYNISYDLDGGTATNPATYTVESDAITLNNPVKTGYTFTGWSGTGLTGENNMTVSIAKGSTGDRAYTAHYTEKNSFTVAFDTNGGSSISDKTGVKLTDTVLSGITAPTKDGWEFTGWKCGDMTVNANTKYSDLATNDTITSVTLVAQWKDITAPTGEISIGTNKWNGFLNTITFGLFFKDTQTVTVTASDNSGDAVKIEYLLSDKALSETELVSATFTSYTDSFSINPDNKYIVYAKLTDTNSNATYINSEGIVFDATVPVITGVENGKTYCEAQTVTVTEEYIESVKVNGTAVTLDENNRFILNQAEGKQTIVVTDKAGNLSAEITVTVNDGHTDNGKDHLCDICGVKFSEHTGGTATCRGKAVCEYCGEEYGELDSSNHAGGTKNHGEAPATYLSDGYTGDTFCIGCGEKLSVGEVIPKLTHDDPTHGVKFYTNCSADGHNYKAYKWPATEFTMGCTQYICDKCGDEYWDNYTKKDTSEVILMPSGKDFEFYITPNLNSTINKDNVKNNPILQAFLQDPSGTLKRMEDDGIKMYKIIDGAEQTVASKAENIVFRSDAPFKEFDQVMINGLVLDKKYYSVKKGSTIVTLNEDFAKEIPTGMHLFGIISKDGVAITTFTVDDKAAVDNDTKSPQTGDNNHIALWVALLFLSGGAVFGTTIVIKKKKHGKH